MGQQQLLMVVLTMILVGVAIVVGQTMFEANAINNTQSVLAHDLLFYASKARGYYWRPSYLGGAHKDFTNVVDMNLFSGGENDDGYFTIVSATQDQLVLEATGKLVIGGDSIKVKVTVDERRSVIEYFN